MVYERNTLVKIAGIRGRESMMPEFEIKGVRASVRLGPLSFTISQDEVDEERKVEKCTSCLAHWHRVADEPKYKFCPNCAAPLENP